MWRYISDDWFVQEVREGEVGSSVMAQKINPIDFENSEGNVQIANSLLEGMGRKLAVSRLQRDLSDSTTVRNVGLALAYGLLAYRNTLAGLGRVHPNIGLMREKLGENWTILSEGVQTVLRRAGEKDPYSLVASLSRGKKIDQNGWQEWVSGLPVAEEIKDSLRRLTPEKYLGNAEELTEMFLREIELSRQNK